jgi:hypothetical protein
MARTIILAPTASKGSTSAFVVAAGETVTVSLYAPAGFTTDDFSARLQMEIPGSPSVFVDVVSMGDSYLSWTNRTYAIAAPGTYRYRKSASTDLIGLYVES